MPKSAIHDAVDLELVAGVARVEGGQHVERQRPGGDREQQRHRLVQLGSGPSAPAPRPARPRPGRRPARWSSGSRARRARPRRQGSAATSEGEPREEVAEDDDHAGRHPQGVGADEAGLDLAQAPAGEPRPRAATPLTAPSMIPRSKAAVASNPSVPGPPTNGRDGLVVVPGVREHRRLDRPDPLLEVDGGGEADAGQGGDDGDDRQGHLGAGGHVDVDLVLDRRPARASASRMWRSSLKGRLSAPPTNDEHGQHDQRQRHQPRRLVGLESSWCVARCAAVAASAAPPRPRRARSAVGVAPALLAEEDHEHLAAHVEGGEQGGDQADAPTAPGDLAVGEEQDLVLRPEPGERRHAGDGQPADDEGGAR